MNGPVPSLIGVLPEVMSTSGRVGDARAFAAAGPGDEHPGSGLTDSVSGTWGELQSMGVQVWSQVAGLIGEVTWGALLVTALVGLFALLLLLDNGR